MIITNLEFTRQQVSMTIIKPLTQLREMILKALSGQTNLSKSFQSYFIEAMELFLTIPNRINFLQMGRFGRSSEQRFRMNFRKKFDWISFNRTLVQEGKATCRAIAIDPSYISKSGKKTPGVGYFWSGCASAVKWGLELMDFALVDADAGTGAPQSMLPDSLGKTIAWICPSAMSSCSYTMLQWLNEYFQRSEKART